jgi:hypothetical protein
VRKQNFRVKTPRSYEVDPTIVPILRKTKKKKKNIPTRGE